MFTHINRITAEDIVRPLHNSLYEEWMHQYMHVNIATEATYL